MAKAIIKNYTFVTASKTITLTDVTTVRLDKLALITDVTTNKILYNFADATVATATVAGNIITLSALQGGESGTDKLRIDYDVESSDTTAFADATQPISASSLTNGSQKTQIVDGSGNVAGATTSGVNIGLNTQLTGITFTLSTLNSSTAQLAPSAVFTGTIESAFNQPAVQLLIVSDQNYTVNLDQFDGASNLISTDTFARLANVALNENIQVNGDSCRVRVTNTGNSITTTLRIETTFGPLNPLPRSNTNLGNLKTAVNELNGTAIDTGTGASTAGTQRVTISDDSIRSITSNTASAVLGMIGSTPVSFQITDGDGNPVDSKNGSLSVIVDPQSPINVAPVFKDVVVNGNAVNQVVIPVTDTTGFSSINVQISGTFVATMSFQFSNDGVTWSTASATRQSNGAMNGSITTVGQFDIPVRGRFFRGFTTAYTSGVIQGTARFSSLAPESNTVAIGIVTSAADAFGSNIILPQDNNGSTGLSPVAGYVFNGTTTDRIRAAVNATNSTGTGIQATSPTMQFDDVSPTAITENQFGHQRMSANRNAYETIRDAAGNERGANVTADNKLTTKDIDVSALEEGNQLILQAILDAITLLPNIQSFLDNRSRTVVVNGATIDKIQTANVTITASTTETVLFQAPAGTKAHLRSIVISNTSASTACRIDLRDKLTGVVIHTWQTVGGAPSTGGTMGGSVFLPQTAQGESWTITCGTSTTDIRISATFEIA